MTRSAQLATLAAAALALQSAGSARAQTCAGNRHCWHVGATHANCCHDEEPPRYEERVPACARDLAREAAGLPAGPSGGCDPSALAASCDQGDPLACEELGHLAAERGASEAVRFFERACAGGRLHGCGAGGLSALREARTEEERRRAEAMLWFACSPPHDPAGGDPVACFHWAEALASRRPVDFLAWYARTQALERGCEGGVGQACARAAELFRRGHPRVGRDRARAAELRARACALGEPSACPAPAPRRSR